MTVDVEAYLQRIGLEGPVQPTLETLCRLQGAHLQQVPFENLAVFGRRRVSVDDAATLAKVVDDRRGGWCFEVNGAFGALLGGIGFAVRRLGAAVLLAGPNVVVDHLVLEVVADDEPHLVEVGFGAGAPITPMPLNRRGPFTSPNGTFELLASPEGTTLTEHVDGVPEPRYRFRRVALESAAFGAASDRLQDDRTLHWSTSPFATRLLDAAGTRLTLTRDRLKTGRPDGSETTAAVDPGEWNDVLFERFGIREQFTPKQLRRPPR